KLLLESVMKDEGMMEQLGAVIHEEGLSYAWIQTFKHVKPGQMELNAFEEALKTLQTDGFIKS
ncbi:hypothetical protein FRB98_009017, partial [Tulasnella sp. 332]